MVIYLYLALTSKLKFAMVSCTCKTKFSFKTVAYGNSTWFWLSTELLDLILLIVSLLQNQHAKYIIFQSIIVWKLPANVLGWLTELWTHQKSSLKLLNV